MPTYTALTTLPGQDAAEALAEALEDLDAEPTGVGVFEIEDGSGLWEVGAYFLEPPDEIALTLLAMAFKAQPFALSELPEIDWVAKVRRELSPVDAGRFFVYGSHDADKVPDGAHRPADRGDGGLRHRAPRHDAWMPARARPAWSIAAKWRGMWRISAAARRCWPWPPRGCSPTPSIASDIDEVAVDVARANAEMNGLADRVICLEAAGFDHPRPAGGGALRPRLRQYPEGSADRACPVDGRPCRVRAARRSSRACWWFRPRLSLLPMSHAAFRNWSAKTSANGQPWSCAAPDRAGTLPIAQ